MIAPAMLWACSLALAAAEVQTRRIVLTAEDAFEQGQGAWGVARAKDGGIALYDAELIEDDGPAIGSDADWLRTDRAPLTELGPEVRVKKVLHIDRPGAASARLVIPPGVIAELNGQTFQASADGEYPDVSPSGLRAGDNVVILRAAPGAKAHLKWATRAELLRNAPDRQSRPPRSFQSADGGKTWLAIEGEYMVRLHLTHFAPSGSFISQVLDLGGELEERPLLSPVKVRSVTLRPEQAVPEGAGVELLARSGDTPVYEPAHWSDWQSAGSVGATGYRYLQWQARLHSANPLLTPVLHTVVVEATLERPDAPGWVTNLKSDGFHNEVIRTTSLPFAYEDPLLPELVAIRRKYKLDDVVAGSTSETEQMVKLRNWAAHQWKIHAPEENYPPWNADAIISQGGGFCVQYAITMMQCAISLGHQARFVFGNNPGAFDGGGHEVCEVWSDEHRKWVFYDVNQNWHYLDRSTRAPMSMLEVHDLIAKTYYGGGKARPDAAPQKRLPSEALAVCYGLSLTPNAPPEEFARHFDAGLYTVPTRWLFTRYLDRNNFLSRPYPQPKTQGTHWDWSEYVCWQDAVTPRQWLYRNFTARRSDIAWTLNQVRFDARPAEAAGVVVVRMGTFTPHFDCFLVGVDGAEPVPSAGVYNWTLHPGRNRLAMCTRNTSKVLGGESFLELDYQPQSPGAAGRANF